MDLLCDHIVFAKQRTMQELLAKHTEVSARFLHASAGIRWILFSSSGMNGVLPVQVDSIFVSIELNPYGCCDHLYDAKAHRYNDHHRFR